MRKGRKIHENKKDIDPGQIRHGIEFFSLTTVSDGFGGVTVTEVSELKTKCAKLPVSENSLSQAMQMGLIADATQLVAAWYFVIRSRKGWIPEKDMTVTVDGLKYVINGITPLSDPITYYRLLCSISV